MNRGNRALGRGALIVAGLALIIAGVEALLLALTPSARQMWRTATAGAARALASATRGPSGGAAAGPVSAWWVVIGVSTAVAILAIVVLATRGGGRTDEVIVDEDRSGRIPGVVRVSTPAVQRALSTAIDALPEVQSLAVDVYAVRRVPTIRVRVRPHRGVAPRRLIDDVTTIVEGLDDLLGTHLPVLLHVARSSGNDRAPRVR
ncbi:hypothetical protein [Curtobacterium ammoniigenes]|uniref:hypothetical protein n=1 Tax=Curtobacterium ammoniigenes TaxID=395387 RepID=UPI000835E36E|nr:hypothetical protein [Curtobacterium ammoniigenes]